MSQSNYDHELNTLGFNLLNHQLNQNQKNILISPASIVFALALLANGAEGSTRNAIMHTLGISNLDILNDLLSGILSHWNIHDPSIEIKTSSSIWINSKLELSQKYIHDVKTMFDAHIEATQLAKAADKINAWVSDATRTMIPKIVTPDLLQGADVLLINALYFNGLWKKPFKEVIPWHFDLLDGSVRAHELMLTFGKWNYCEDSIAQIVELPYGAEAAMSMIIVLPTLPWPDFVMQLNAAQWIRWMAALHPMSGNIWLPKFKARLQTNVLKPLIECGLGPAVYDGDYRPLGISPLSISGVLHEVCLEVDEKGSRAAAATAIVARMTGLTNVEKTFTMRVDRPFFCAIRDNRSGMILFLGLITDPDVL